MRKLTNTLLFFIVVQASFGQFIESGLVGSKLCDEKVIRQTSIHDTLTDNKLLSKSLAVNVVTKDITIAYYFSSEKGTTPKIVETDLYQELPEPEEGTPNPLGIWKLNEKFFLDGEEISPVVAFSLVVNPYSECYQHKRYGCDSIKMYRLQRRLLCPAYETFTTTDYKISNDSIYFYFKDRTEPLEVICLADGWVVHTDSVTVKSRFEQMLYNLIVSKEYPVVCIDGPCPPIEKLIFVDKEDFRGCIVNATSFSGIEAGLIYPNPTAGLVHVEGSNDVLELHDIYNKTYFVKGDGTYDLTALPKGIYFLKVEINGAMQVVKLLKE